MNNSLEQARENNINIDPNTKLTIKKWLLYLKFQKDGKEDYSDKIKKLEKEIDEILKKHPEYGTKEKIIKKIKSMPVEPAYNKEDFMTDEQKTEKEKKEKEKERQEKIIEDATRRYDGPEAWT